MLTLKRNGFFGGFILVSCSQNDLGDFCLNKLNLSSQPFQVDYYQFDWVETTK